MGETSVGTTVEPLRRGFPFRARHGHETDRGSGVLLAALGSYAKEMTQSRFSAIYPGLISPGPIPEAQIPCSNRQKPSDLEKWVA